MMREIGVLVFPGFQLLDLGGPVAAFQMAGYGLEPAPYRIRVLSVAGGPVCSSVGVAVDSEPADGGALDTLLVAGGAGSRPASRIAAEAAFVRAAAPCCRRVTSVCTGAFILAEAGLLDGRAATTHWRYAATLQRLYPPIQVDGDRIFIRDGTVWTSAGITAGIDLALALIEDDLGRDGPRRGSWWYTIGGRVGSRSSRPCWSWIRRPTASARRWPMHGPTCTNR
jgi:transcriptional regulator GlxA family with amidase domain